MLHKMPVRQFDLPQTEPPEKQHERYHQVDEIALQRQNCIVAEVKENGGYQGEQQVLRRFIILWKLALSEIVTHDDAEQCMARHGKDGSHEGGVNSIRQQVKDVFNRRKAQRDGGAVQYTVVWIVELHMPQDGNENDEPFEELLDGACKKNIPQIRIVKCPLFMQYILDEHDRERDDGPVDEGLEKCATRLRGHLVPQIEITKEGQARRNRRWYQYEHVLCPPCIFKNSSFIIAKTFAGKCEQ